MLRKIFYTCFFLSLFFFSNIQKVYCQNDILTGTILGMLIDKETKTPLIGANVVLLNTLIGAATDETGKFIIKNVPVGAYSLQFSYIGYESLIKTDIIVKPERITYINAELKISSLETETIKVSADYFSDNSEQPLSVTSFSREEIRRAPGSGGDVSRIIMSLPSIAKVNDQTNSLIVRGGSPVENAFYIDNIEIPNINHFPTQGASGGPIGLLNVDFIKDVNFYSGGFTADFGDRLSSIMDITFREGNREEFDGQLDLNFAGFGGVAEGPLFNKKGYWMISVRRSYLDILVKNIDIGTSIAPTYGDVQAKIVYDINQNHKLSFVSVWGDDHNNPDKKTAIENDMIYYGNQNIYEGTTGINWRVIWKNNGYSNTSIAYTSIDFCILYNLLINS